jgi:hypothetical protein
LIYLVSGPPGNGKTYYAIRKIVEALEHGKVVAGNVELVPDWPEQMVRHSYPYWFNWWARRRLLQEGEDRFLFTEDLDQLAGLRLLGRGESRGLLVLDEGHNWMNARSWTADDRKKIVRFFSQHRKLGWDVLLIAQHPEMIDKQVRNLVEYNVHLRNLKKAKWGGIPIFPFNLFLAVWQWHSAQRVIVKREVFRLTWRKELYDTYATSHGLNNSEDEASGQLLFLPAAPWDRGTSATADGSTRPGAGARPQASAAPPAPRSAPQGPGPSGGSEDAEESGEGEAWGVKPDYRPPVA